MKLVTSVIPCKRQASGPPSGSLGVVGAVLVCASALMLALGCGPQGSGPAEETTAAAGSGGEYPVTLTDSAGREVTIEHEPERIASMAPSVTETLFAVGAGEKVVGVTTSDDYPEEVRDLETVGDFQQVNVEKILALETDLLFLSFAYSTEERAEELEEQTQADVVVVDPETLDEVLESVETVGLAAGEPEGGRELRQRMEAELREVEEAVAGEPRPTVFYEVFGDPLQTVGPGSFIHDALVRAGGANIAADTDEAYPTYSAETVVERDPDFYLLGSLSGTSPEDIADRPGFSELTAVREGQVATVEDDLISRPGPRLPQGVRQIAETLHPESFSGE